ncbi:MAG TPA: cysteine hydrolase family protein [Allosphingosinicella sp.]
MQIRPNAALVAIDVQQGFDQPSWGRRNNPAMEANGRALIAAWRATGRPLIHTRHDSRTAGSPLAPGHSGNNFKAGFEPLAGELIVPKTVNSAFIGTDLEPWLRRVGISQLVLFGIATDMCVSTTTRMAANLGFEAIVAADACHTWDQAGHDGRWIDADTIHRANLATLHTEFARVVTSADLLEWAQLRLAG